MRRGVMLVCLAAAAACGCGGSTAGGDAGPASCTADDDCDDGRFCNGRERCRPEAATADRRGCVPAPDVCAEDRTCDEEADRCIPAGGCALTADSDGDGHAARACGGDDCDDTAFGRFPGNAEVCDPGGVDEDCDPATVGGRDADGDGAVSSTCCNTGRGGETRCGPDCDDTTAARAPGRAEACDGLDNDCDGNVDEDATDVPWYPDADGDGFGGDGEPVRSCAPVEGRSTLGTDCADDDPARHPGATERCNAVDDDCDGELDEGLLRTTWYPDADGDRYGDEAGATQACARLMGHVLRGRDCADGDPAIHPSAIDLCDDTDNDCDGAVDEAEPGSRCRPEPGWLVTGGDTGADRATAVAVDDDDRLYVVGAFRGTIDLDGATALSSSGGADAFIASYEASGAHRWQRAIGGAGDDVALDVAVDPGLDLLDASDDVVYVAGRFHDGIDFGSDTASSAGGSDGFVASYDVTGSPQWARAFGGPGADEARGAATDGEGAIAVAGAFSSGASVGSTSLTNAGGLDVLVAEWDRTGTLLWAAGHGGPGRDEAFGAAGAPSLGFATGPGVVVSGRFEGDVDFGGGPYTSAGMGDAFVAVYDQTGTHHWSTRFGSSADDAGTDAGVFVMSTTVVGYVGGPVDFGGGTRTPSGGRDAFVAQLRLNDGTHTWSAVFGGPGADEARAVKISSDVYVTGTFEDTLVLGGDMLTSAGMTDVFHAGFEETGDIRHALRFGGPEADRGNGVTTDGSTPHIGYVAGSFGGTVGFGTTSASSAGSADLFLLELLAVEPPG